MEKEMHQEMHPAITRLTQELVIAGYSPKTIDMYSMYARGFLAFSKKQPQDAKREDVVAFLAFMKTQKACSAATLALAHASLKYFFHGVLKKKILDEIRPPKKDKKIPDVLTIDEVRSLIKATKTGRNRLLVELLYSSGLRVSELVNMRVNSLNLKEKTGVVKAGKGSKDRLIILSKAWVKSVKKYLGKKKVKSEFVFSKKNGKSLSVDTVERIIKNAAQKAQLTKHVTPHTLRHCFATHLLDAGENIRKIQELLGHSSLNTTQIYTHTSTAQLKKVISPLDKM